MAVKCSGNLLTSLQGADLCLSSWLGRYCPNTSNSQGSSEPNIRSTSKKSQALLRVKCWCSLIGGHHRANVSICQSAWLYALICHEKHPPISVSLHATVKVVRRVTLYMRGKVSCGLKSLIFQLFGLKKNRLVFIFQTFLIS